MGIDGFSVYGQVGLSPVSVTGDAARAPVTQQVALTGDEQVPLWSPRNPLLWFGAILAVTVGAASVAGSVRLGKAKISASAGS